MEFGLTIIGVLVALLCLDPLAKAYRRWNETGEATLERRKREALDKVNQQHNDKIAQAYEVDPWWI